MTTQTAASQPAPATDPRAFKSFADFYPFYLSEHSNRCLLYTSPSPRDS